MRTDRVALNYQREDDILCVTFEPEGRTGMGVNLDSNVLLRFDRQSGEPLGLTFIDYSKLKELQIVPFDDFSKLPEGVEQNIRDILLSDPVCRFIEINSDSYDHFTVVNPSVGKVIAA